MADGSTALTIRQWKLAFIVAGLALLDAGGMDSSKPEYRPDLVLDLRQFGYEKPDKFREQAEYQALQNSIVFVDNDTLALSLFVRNPHPGFSVRNKLSGGPYLFQTVFLDAGSGRILHSQTWSNAAIGCGLFPANNGTFVIERGLELSLHGPDGTLLKSLSLSPKDFPRTPSLKQSPSGNTLFAFQSDRTGDHVLRIRTSDLQPLGWLDFAGYFSGAGSDSYFAFVRAVPGSPPSKSDWGGPPMQLFMHRFDAEDAAHAEPDLIHTTPTPGCTSVVFLDNETLGLSGMCHEFLILNKAGTILYQQRFEREMTSPMLPCRSCDLVAFGTYVLRGGSSWSDTFPKAKGRSIILFNRRTRQVLELPYTMSTGNLSSSKALSPNGCLLALQSDSRIEVFRTCNLPIRGGSPTMGIGP
jgi:hypothetical protein